MESFNLYQEAKSNYDLLVPEKSEGLILLSLYDKWGIEEFTELQINDTIDKIYRDLGRQSNRNAFDRNSSIILKLQEFFLWRDELKKNYRFKSYGEEFCKKIKERLEHRYSPAEIKRLFDSLYLELLRHIEDDELNFLLWYKEQFKRRTTDIVNQVEILDQQVSESVREFRSKIKNSELNLFRLLEEIEISLDLIKQYAVQLKDTFKSTYDIEYKLQDLIADPNSQENIGYINDVLNFYANIRSQLEQVSDRIDKIKPRIREFIYDFNQRDFDRKTVLFLQTLLTLSASTKNDKGKRIINLPFGIPEFQIYGEINAPKFVLIPDKDITPKIPVEVTTRVANQKRQEERIKAEKKRLLERKRILFWFNNIKQQVNDEGSLEYSNKFYEILKEENNNLLIVTKLTSKIIRELSQDMKFKVIVRQEEISNTLFKKTRIWKMQIQKS